MATEIVMPRLSDTMDSGTVAKWLKQEGDPVKRGEVIAEIETDKANMDMESYAEGILARISVGEGESAGVGQPIALIAADQEEAAKLRDGKTAEAKPAKAQRAEPRAEQTPPDEGPPAAPQADGTEPNERVKASPLARRIAQEHGVELHEVAGTGPAGRITKDDVQAFLKQVAPMDHIPRTEKVETAAPSIEVPAKPSGPGRAGQPVEMTRMRTTIARRLTQARFTAPDFLLTAEFDMTEARVLLDGIAGVEGAPKIGPNDLLIRAVAVALTKHPEVNAGWENDQIVRYGNINVGFAVATPGGGLVAPVVRNTNRKSLGEIASEAKSLRDRAREGKLAPSDYEDGTFTVSNLGMYGIDQFTSILNPPEACSLAVGAITRKSVVIGDELVMRDRVRVTLTCDHRVVNGAQGAEFLQTLRSYVERPALALL